MTSLDKTVRPQDDFFGYVNNKWLKDNPIPPNESVWTSFHVLRDKSAAEINNIVNELQNAKEDTLSHDQKLIKTYFSTALSYPSYKSNHLKTLKEDLQNIQSIENRDQLSRYLGYAHRYNFTSFWFNYVSLDDKNSQTQVLYLHQDGLYLPNRDYYLDESDRMKNIRKEYELHFQAIHDYIPEQSPSDWNAVFEIESRLALSSWTEVELRDVEKNYTRFSLNELQSKFPELDWIEYFKAQGWENPSDYIVINQPSFIEDVMNIIKEYPLDKIKQYLSWHAINKRFSWVDETAAKICFDFNGKIINGKKENHPTWKRAVLQADELIIGEILGREYAKRNFPESSKQSVLELTEDVRSAYHKRIDQVTWMKDNTKKRAHQKLDNIRVLIGYPSKWHDLSKLQFSNDNHLSNVLVAHGYLTDIALAKIGQEPDLEDWQMHAHTVNAYHDPNQLVICFPAAILQPPFYDPDASYATNLGGIGSIIGHELTHGFDDQGGEFDEQGNVKRWQTKAEKALFKKIAKNIVKQADNYEALPGLFLKGELILGEAIADIGGIELALEVLRAKTDPNNLDSSIRELFINAAVVERGTQREEFLVRQVKTDPHPPSRFRVNCVLSHIDTFYDIYDVKPGDKLYLPPNERAHIW